MGITPKKVLVACEFSQVVTRAFRERGHEAYSCDILPTEGNPEWHIQDDVLKHLDDGWDLMIAHPPCTYLTVTGNKWFKPEYRDRFPTREQQRQEAIYFFMRLKEAKIPKIAIENPIGVMSTVYRKPDQIIQPYWFGDKKRKATCLWLKGLEPLTVTCMVEPIIVQYKTRRGTDDDWHINTMKLPPLQRMKERSRTFPGIANAMAEQWGGI